MRMLYFVLILAGTRRCLLLGLKMGKLKVHGLKSGKLLMEFRGHASFVNDAIFTNDGFRVITASSDCSVKVWDVKTTDCLHTFKPPPPLRGGAASVNSVHIFSKNIDHVIVCNKTSSIYLMTLQGQETIPTESSQVFVN